MRREWPVLLVAAALLLAASAQAFLDGGDDVLGGALLALGSATLGAWLGSGLLFRDSDENKD